MAKKVLLQLFVIPFVCFMASAMVQAETQTVNINVRQPFSENQPPESSRFLAIVRAKRAALEKAVMYIENLSVLKKRALGKKDLSALAAGVLETEIVSQKNYTTADAFGYEVSVSIMVDTNKLESQVSDLLNNTYRMTKYLAFIERENQLLSRISGLESEGLKLKNATAEEKESVKQRFQTTISALSALVLYKKAADRVKDQRSNKVPEEAIGYLRTAINLDPEFKDAYLWLGKISSDNGKYERAVEYYQKALVINLKTLGEINPERAVAYNRLGLAFHRNGEYDRAIDAYQRAWKIQIHTVGENHPDVATTYNNLGESYREKGDYDKAIEYYQKDLDITLTTLGRNHPNVATAYNNLAYAWHDKGNDDRAMEYFKEALESYRKTLGKNAPQTKTVEKTIDFLKSQHQ